MRSIQLALLILVAVLVPAGRAQELRVMTFNLWHGGDAGGQPLGQTIHAIRKSMADIVGLQETHGYEVDGVRPDNGSRIAEALGWHYFQQGGRTGILSRFPIGKSTKNKWGVEIEYEPGKTLLMVNAHFAASPYQPYQLLNIPYGDAPFIQAETQAIRWAEKARGGQVARMLSDIRNSIEKGWPILLTGDFNEPSFQDWTPRAVAAKLCPIKVEYPATKRIAESGLTDAWRAVHRDEVAVPGWTWTPTTKPDDLGDRHDRIDFVFVSSKGIMVKDCQRVAEPGNSEISVPNWPSDHRGVVATIAIAELRASIN